MARMRSSCCGIQSGMHSCSRSKHHFTAGSFEWCRRALASSNELWAPQLAALPLQHVLRAVEARGAASCRDYWCVPCRLRSVIWALTQCRIFKAANCKRSRRAAPPSAATTGTASPNCSEGVLGTARRRRVSTQDCSFVLSNKQQGMLSGWSFDLQLCDPLFSQHHYFSASAGACSTGCGRAC